MSLYQIAFSVTCIFGAVTGLCALARKVLTGTAGEFGTMFSLSVCFALALAWIIGRRPMLHEAVFRVAGSPPWHELTRFQRCYLMLLDWPLFSAIRDKEIQRLWTQPLVRVVVEGDRMTLEPIEGQHRSRFFLSAIARSAARYGLKAAISARGLLYRDRLFLAEIEIVGSDMRMTQYLHDNLSSGDLMSLSLFMRHIENAYASTLPEDQRYVFITAMR